jgi:hypothetical protein
MDKTYLVLAQYREGSEYDDKRASYTDGAIVRTTKGVFKCQDGKWVNP